MNTIKITLRFVFPLLSLAFIGCTTVRYYPTNFVESLKHPTKFPEVYSSTVKNIEEVAEKNPLGEGEEAKITDVGENKNSSMHLVQVRENGELHPHYHKRHDEVVYVKKGSGIATLDGTRYMVKPGSILQVPAKTVHKFLNTGGEPFVAVSIFSPPFDGRDEKRIKEKRKADRIKKEEKRLAMKKPEKFTEEKDVSVTKEYRYEEEKKPVVKPEKVTEKHVNESLKEESNTEEENEKISIPDKKSTSSKGKKKSKKTVTPAEEPTMDISDLHEKLTKLLELKEEGTISAVEYEEKQDALMRGEGIGELPEPKSPVKYKTQIEEEPIGEQAKEEHIQTEEEHIPADENVSYEDQDTLLNMSSLYDETEPAVHEVEAEEKVPQTEDDKLKMLEEMRQEGLITEEDYESKKRKLTDITEEKPASMPSENIVEDESEDEKVEELKELYNEGLITEEDYKHKLGELSSPKPQDLIPAPNKEEVEDDKLSELNELREEGLISDEDYEFKKTQLMGE
jgi:quercetin dioxygenase-like cupin family protein